MNTWEDGTPKSTGNAFSSAGRPPEINWGGRSNRQMLLDATRVNVITKDCAFKPPEYKAPPAPPKPAQPKLATTKPRKKEKPQPTPEQMALAELKRKQTRLMTRVRELSEQRDKWRERADFFQSEMKEWRERANFFQAELEKQKRKAAKKAKEGWDD